MQRLPVPGACGFEAAAAARTCSRPSAAHEKETTSTLSVERVRSACRPCPKSRAPHGMTTESQKRRDTGTVSGRTSGKEMLRSPSRKVNGTGVKKLHCVRVARLRTCGVGKMKRLSILLHLHLQLPVGQGVSTHRCSEKEMMKSSSVATPSPQKRADRNGVEPAEGASTQAAAAAACAWAARCCALIAAAAP